jgi:hypothetical protein
MEWGQALATLRTATLQNGTSVFGRHSCTESVLLGATAIVGLISSLWHRMRRPLL